MAADEEPASGSAVDISSAEVDEDQNGSSSFLSSSSIVVLQPGSFNLYYGLASDAVPRSMPHAIARRRRQTLHGWFVVVRLL